ncbi:hypothetical protein BKA80DRAFT_277903 [Phyllosticta citrichinensis]
MDLMMTTIYLLLLAPILSPAYLSRYPIVLLLCSCLACARPCSAGVTLQRTVATLCAMLQSGRHSTVSPLVYTTPVLHRHHLHHLSPFPTSRKQIQSWHAARPCHTSPRLTSAPSQAA